MRFRAPLAILVALSAGCGGGGGDDAAWVTTDELIVPGSVQSIVVDPQGRAAYLSNGAALLVLDLKSRRLTRATPFTVDFGRVMDIDSTGQLLAMQGVTTAGVLDVATGEQIPLITGQFVLQGSVRLANGKLYAPNPGVTGLQTVALDGSGSGTITPSINRRATGIRNVARTRSGTTIVFDDNVATLFVVDTETDTPAGPYFMGFYPSNLFALDDDHALAVGGGLIATIDFAQPDGVPQLARIDFLDGAVDAALDRTEKHVIVLRLVSSPAGSPSPMVYPEIGVVDLETNAVSRTMRIGEPEPPSEYSALPPYRVAVTAENELLVVLGDALYFLAPVVPLS